jgi:endonuclease YncB( thermonuclease family)
MLTICLRFLLVSFLCLGSAACAVGLSGQARVIDGDTIAVGGSTVRLYGIDAPERDQPCTTLSGQNWACGDWVTRQLRDRIEGRELRCAPRGQDRYGRTLAKCYDGQQDIGQALVQAGLAYAYRRYAMDYDLDEKAALVAKRGLHGHLVQSPARYRLTRVRGRSAPDPACRIKGNISARGARIYHLPGQKFYDRTGIRLDKGERWFCSEAQARASGWRRARQ